MRKRTFSEVFPDISIHGEVISYNEVRKTIVANIRKNYGSVKSFSTSYSRQFGVSEGSMRSILSENGAKSFSLIKRLIKFLDIGVEEINVNITYYRDVE